MDPNDAFSATLFKWDHHRAPAAPSPPPPHRSLLHSSNPTPTIPPPQPPPPYCHPKELDVLESFFQHYGIRYFTLAKMAELGFTLNTLLNMKDEELDEMIGSLAEIFRWDLLVGERYGIKAAIRAERRRVEDESRHRHFVAATAAADTSNPLDALSQEGLSEEPVQQEKEAAGSGSGAGGVAWDVVAEGKKQRRRRAARGSEDDDGSGGERQREHPFIVTEPGEVARGKKNGLDYLFHLYEQCRNFLIEVQNLAKDRGEKCPTKVTNQVFRYAKKAGASYINKPKMRHYVHCYALHCLDEEASNRLRRAFKERGENVGAWRQACYQPLVAMAARQGWDIDAIFNNHHRLSIWYVPTKLRQLCHMERSNAAAVAVAAVVAPLPAK